jgi:hypothetical protein
MRLFIQIRDGQPFGHPIFEDNFVEAFPHIDLDSLPPEFALFERVENPRVAGTYQVDEVSYQWVDDIVKDVWTVREMTAEEKSSTKEKLVQNAKANWALKPNRENYVAWVFNEAACEYQPPIPRPETGNYFWQGTTSSWVELPQRPDDGKAYRLDFASAIWVEVTQS